MTTDIRHIILSAFLLCGWVSCTGPAQQEDPDAPATPVLSFPGAEGGGKYTDGGRGTAVYMVTSLEDNPTDVKIGTLRSAVQATGRRIIIFAVSGRIDLQGELTIRNGNVSILGQSSPGDGICISGYPVVVNADNVVIRFMRFRMGDLHGAEGDALTIQKGHKQIMIDHCSCSWSTDECLSIYGVEDATVQYCFVTEGLNNSVHAKGAHGYGGIWGGKNTTFHHNLLAHHMSRMPRFDHDFVTQQNVAPVDFINNVVYNWQGNSAYGGESVGSTGNQRQYNFINNYYKYGPATNSSVRFRLLNPTTKCGNCLKQGKGTVVPGLFYLSGNYMYGSESVTADNWSGVVPDEASKLAQCRSAQRFVYDNAYVGEQTAQEAYETVLAKAGCSLRRDTIDERIVEEVRKGTAIYHGSGGSKGGGMIDTPDDVGGWPDYQGTAETDTDGDHIPDRWEIMNGLNPNDPADAKQTNLHTPYLNLEVYLNDIVAHLY
ncbi:MAG: polysaccharide lyase family 1 protein [Paludibacteraceae bacterium]